MALLRDEIHFLNLAWFIRPSAEASDLFLAVVIIRLCLLLAVGKLKSECYFFILILSCDLLESPMSQSVFLNLSAEVHFHWLESASPTFALVPSLCIQNLSRGLLLLPQVLNMLRSHLGK